jgi:hypothetical protein
MLGMAGALAVLYAPGVLDDGVCGRDDYVRTFKNWSAEYSECIDEGAFRAAFIKAVKRAPLQRPVTIKMDASLIDSKKFAQLLIDEGLI